MEALIKFIKQIFSYLIKFIVIVGVGGYLFYVYDQQQSTIDQQLTLRCDNATGDNGIWLLSSSPKSRTSSRYYSNAQFIHLADMEVTTHWVRYRNDDVVAFYDSDWRKNNYNFIFDRRTFELQIENTDRTKDQVIATFDCVQTNEVAEANKRIPEIQKRIESGYKL